MNVSKLFGVLVVGGSLWAASACSDSGNTDRNKQGDPDAKASQVDATAGDDDANMSLADANTNDASELAPCFCNSEACCDNGNLQFGFECCWGTTC